MKLQQDRLEIVPEHIDFAEEERKILQKWRDKNTFQTSLEFVFFFKFRV
jgi:isoleucyl-tRNA synthetase